MNELILPAKRWTRPTSVVVIQDIFPFIRFLATISPPRMQAFNVNYATEFDNYVTWVINHILTTRYQLSVLGHYRSDNVFLSIFDDDAEQIVSFFQQTVYEKDLKYFAGYFVKTLAAGPDLFIVPAIQYSKA